MRASHVWVVLLFLVTLPFLSREAQRGYAAWLLHRGDYARLEALDEGTYFVPALRAYTRDSRKSSQGSLMAWANRRLQPLIPRYSVSDLTLHSSGLLLVALTLNLSEGIDGVQEWRRLVALDPRNGMSIVADICPYGFNGASGLELQLADVEGDGQQEILLSIFGTAQSGRLFRLAHGRFEQIRSGDESGDFMSWTGFDFVDLDGDGILEIRGCQRSCFSCSCGRESQADVVTWKLEKGRYRRWTIRAEDCGASCEKPWTR